MTTATVTHRAGTAAALVLVACARVPDDGALGRALERFRDAPRIIVREDPGFEIESIALFGDPLGPTPPLTRRHGGVGLPATQGQAR